MPPNRPGQLMAATVLLGATWSIMAFLLAWVTSNAYEVAGLADEMWAAHPELERPGEPGIGKQYGVYWGLLLLTLCVLFWAIPRALGGHRPGRVGLWVMAAVLALEPLRICVVAIVNDAADATMVFLALIGIGASSVAAVLMMLPPVNAYLRGDHQPNPHSQDSISLDYHLGND